MDSERMDFWRKKSVYVKSKPIPFDVDEAQRQQDEVEKLAERLDTDAMIVFFAKKSKMGDIGGIVIHGEDSEKLQALLVGGLQQIGQIMEQEHENQEYNS
jgi:LPS O-antigen subunit length determinant protein (WzzB/FepE family)